ncbi:MAG: thioesterase family protein [Stappiaceae bacterium]
MSAIESLHAFVNRWECDENDHMNVQFYFAKFQEADRQFAAMTGLTGSLVGARRVRHIRYHREVTAGTLLRVLSSIAFDGPHMFSVLHEMIDVSSGTLVAAAMDGYSPSAKTAQSLRPRFIEYESSANADNSPLGIGPSVAGMSMTAKSLLARGARVVHQNTVMPRDCGPDSRADDQFLAGCFSDGAAHVWERTPMNRSWLESNGYGRVAVEMKLSYGTALKMGSSVQVVSGITGMGSKTFSFRHHVFDVVSGAAVAMVDVVALSLDLKTRKAVELPKSAVTELQALRIL